MTNWVTSYPWCYSRICFERSRIPRFFSILSHVSTLKIMASTSADLTQCRRSFDLVFSVSYRCHIGQWLRNEHDVYLQRNGRDRDIIDAGVQRCV